MTESSSGTRSPFSAAAFILPVLFVMAFGLFNGRLVKHFRIQPIVATPILFIATGRVLGVPSQVVMMIMIAALAYGLIRYAVIGRHTIAVGGNHRLAIGFYR